MTLKVVEENIFHVLGKVAYKGVNIEEKLFEVQRKWNLSFVEVADIYKVMKEFDIKYDPHYEIFYKELKKILKGKNL